MHINTLIMVEERNKNNTNGKRERTENTLAYSLL